MGQIIEVGFLVEPKQVRLVHDGPVYKLPPDVPVPLMLMLEHYAEHDITTELVRDIYEQVLTLFRVYQPDLTELPIGLTQMLTLVRRVYSPDEPQAEQEQAAPPTRRGTKSTSAPRKRASRSSS